MKPLVKHVSFQLTVAVCFFGFVNHSTRAAEKPNALFIAVDDLNDWTGVLGGYPGIETPNLDRLANRGVLFTRAYCSAPACNPSRASLLTGVRPSTSGVYHNSQPWRKAMPDAVTLPQRFQTAGYRVWGGGKIYHGRFPDPASWHEYLKRPNDPYPPQTPVNGIRGAGHFDWSPVQVPDAKMGDTVVTDWGIEFLNQKQDRQFFLAVGLFRPHLPWYAPQKYFDKYPLDKIVLPKVPEDDLDDVPEPGKKNTSPAAVRSTSFMPSNRDSVRSPKSGARISCMGTFMACRTVSGTLVGPGMKRWD